MKPKFLFSAALSATLMISTTVPAFAAAAKFSGWREYHFDMSAKEFAAVHPAACGAQSRPGESGQSDNWIFRLNAATIAAAQERR